jgi:hypothetical protein
MVDQPSPENPSTRARQQAATRRRHTVVLLVFLGLIAAVVVGLRSFRPLASSRNEEAVVAYTSALARLAQADIDGMRAGLQLALERDPGLAAAHLRLVAWSSLEAWLAGRDPAAPMSTAERKSYVDAIQYRGRLDAHDLALLEALTVLLEAPTEHAAFVQASSFALARYGSNEQRFWAAVALLRAGRLADAQRLAEAGDTEHYLPLAWAAARAASLSGDPAGARRHLDWCVKQSPDSIMCRNARAALASPAQPAPP